VKLHGKLFLTNEAVQLALFSVLRRKWNFPILQYRSRLLECIESFFLSYKSWKLKAHPLFLFISLVQRTFVGLWTRLMFRVLRRILCDFGFKRHLKGYIDKFKRFKIQIKFLIKIIPVQFLKSTSKAKPPSWVCDNFVISVPRKRSPCVQYVFVNFL